MICGTHTEEIGPLVAVSGEHIVEVCRRAQRAVNARRADKRKERLREYRDGVNAFRRRFKWFVRKPELRTLEEAEAHAKERYSGGDLYSMDEWNRIDYPVVAGSWAVNKHATPLRRVGEKHRRVFVPADVLASLEKWASWDIT